MMTADLGVTNWIYGRCNDAAEEDGLEIKGMTARCSVQNSKLFGKL